MQSQNYIGIPIALRYKFSSDQTIILWIINEKQG